MTDQADTKKQTGTPRLFIFIGYEAEPFTPEKLLAVLREVTEEEVETGKVIGTGGGFFRKYEASRDVRKMLRYSWPGSVVEIEATDDRIWLKAKSRGLWPDEEDRHRWATASKASERAALGYKNAKKADPFAEALGPVREAYKNARGANRTQLLAAVVEFITK